MDYNALIDYNQLTDLTQVDEIILHCAATRPADDCQADDITQWHCNPKVLTRGVDAGKVMWLGQMYANWELLPADAQRLPQGNGWLAPGYHFFIDGAAHVTPLRPLDKRGAHVRGRNYRSVGVCLAGGLGDDYQTPESNYSDEQLNTAAALIHTLTLSFPNARVAGHHDFDNHKTCPNFDVPAWWAKCQRQFID